MIYPIATTILGDEKAMGFMELNLQSPGSRGIRRYQIIYVIRDGNVAEWRRDMGATTKFKGMKMLNIPALLEYTVDELLDIADYLRTETNIDIKDLLELDNLKLA